MIEITIGNAMWYLQFHFVCDKLFTSFIVMISLCFFCEVGRPHSYSKAKGVLLVYIIAIRLLLNHSPSEWFSAYKKAGAHSVRFFCACGYFYHKIIVL